MVSGEIDDVLGLAGQTLDFAESAVVRNGPTSQIDEHGALGLVTEGTALGEQAPRRDGGAAMDGSSLQAMEAGLPVVNVDRECFDPHAAGVAVMGDNDGIGLQRR